MKWLVRLWKPRRVHRRADGPVRIDPDKREVVHVVGGV